MANISNITLPDGTTKGIRATGILYSAVDSTSTATAYTASIPGVSEYYDGLTILLYNGVVTSAAGFTININGLGALNSYSNMTLGNAITPTAATQDTTIFNINYAMLFVYSSNIRGVAGWICYRGYDANTNTIGYQIRTNSIVKNVTDRTRYYRILFSSADDTKWVPANTQYDNSATSSKTVNQRPINPFGEIVYLGSSTSYTADAAVSATTVWQQYTLALGYSFNRTGAALTLTTKKPVYVKCAPQSDGSAIMDSTTPIVQDLPSTEDGKIYIFLGIAYSATNIELTINHPVYYYKAGSIRVWTNPQAIPTKVSDLTNDSGFITTETDPTVPSWAKASSKPTYTASEVGAVATSAVGAASGVVPLNASSKIDETYLPSYVDDVIEGYYYNNKFWKEAAHTTEITGEAGKIYVDLSTDKTYRYGGTAFVEISSGTTVSVTRDVTTGTKIATITINGTGSDLYAPAGASATQSATTGISIADHGTGSVTGVQSSTTTASKVTLGTAFSVPNVTSAGSASSWTFEEKSIPNVTAAGSGSFTQGAFSGGSLTMAMDSTDTKKLNITFTAATHGTDSHTHTAPTLGTAITVQSKSGGSNGSAPTLGTAFSIPNVTGATDVTVPIKDTSASTFVTGTTHTVTDNGHTHSI